MKRDEAIICRGGQKDENVLLNQNKMIWFSSWKDFVCICYFLFFNMEKIFLELFLKVQAQGFVALFCITSYFMWKYQTLGL